MIRKDCDNCIKRKTMYCPNSSKCYNTFEKPFHLNNIKALEDLDKKENIIKEVREYIEKHIAIFKGGDMLVDMNIEELLEILDKVDKENKEKRS